MSCVHRACLASGRNRKHNERNGVDWTCRNNPPELSPRLTYKQADNVIRQSVSKKDHCRSTAAFSVPPQPDHSERAGGKRDDPSDQRQYSKQPARYERTDTPGRGKARNEPNSEHHRKCSQDRHDSECYFQALRFLVRLTNSRPTGISRPPLRASQHNAKPG